MENVTRHFEIEKNLQIQHDIACLLFYQYFKMKDENDKEGLVSSLTNLITFYNEYPLGPV